MAVKTKTIKLYEYTFNLSLSSTTPNKIVSGSFNFDKNLKRDMSKAELVFGQKILQGIFDGKYDSIIFPNKKD